MNVTAAQMPSLSTLLRLGRISNVPTVWTNVLAGSVIAGGEARADRIALIMIAMTAFYVGGMYLNDFFDLAQGYFARGIEQRLRESNHLSKLSQPRLPQPKLPQRELVARASALAGSTLALLRWWLDRGAKESPRAMDELFHRMVWNGLQ